MPDAPLPPLPPPGQPRWRTWFDDLRRRLPVRPGVVVVVVVAVVVVLAVVGVLLLRPTRPVVLAAAPAVTPAPAEPEPSPKPPGPGEGRAKEEVVVDVAGAVSRPGLVHLRVGARVADALAAAGGLAPEADVAGVNQARVLADGEQVRVLRTGEPPPVMAPAASGGPIAGAPGPVDLNRASATDLDTLPGVGPATAAAIITWRDKNGRFRRVEDLLEVPGIGPARLERLRSLVRV